MLRSEYEQALADLRARTGDVATAGQKMHVGDVRGARVRLERALEACLRVERDFCDAGFLNDPGDDEVNGNKPGRP